MNHTAHDTQSPRFVIRWQFEIEPQDLEPSRCDYAPSRHSL